MFIFGAFSSDDYQFQHQTILTSTFTSDNDFPYRNFIIFQDKLVFCLGDDDVTGTIILI